MSTRPELTAQRRELQGKAVKRLRQDGLLPAVLYGHGHASEALQVDAKAFAAIRRHAGRNALLDLKVDDHRAEPVVVHAVQEHPVRREPIHVDFYLVKMTEEMTVDVPLAMVGESLAVEKLGGTLLRLVDGIKVRALPADLPSTLELDVTPLDSFEAVLHVRDVRLPERVHLVTDQDEPVARVQAPRTEEAPVAAPAEAVEAGAEGAEAGAEGGPGDGEPDAG